MTNASRARELRSAVERRRDELIELVRALVGCDSVLGEEEPAQALVEEQLRAIGFEVERVQPDAEAALADPEAGYPYLSYEGRTSVVGRLPGSGGGRSLHLSGHVDVVPVERPDLWAHAPWSGELAHGRIWGRGAGDMKGGLAAYLVAAAAVAEVCDDRRGDLLFSSVIEEECGGNGMWSVLQAGFEGDAVLIGESTGLCLAHAATGVVWARLSARGAAGHAMLAGGDGPFDSLGRAVAGLRRVEAELNEPVRDPVFAAVRDRPYGMTVGRIEGGVWTASTPHELAAHVRFGFGREVTPAEVQERMRSAVAEAAPDVEVRFEAFRAHAHSHPTEGPLVDALSAAHREVVGTEPELAALTGTVDARYVRAPCLCYGPEAGGLHGTDEWVDVETLMQTAAVVALTADRWTSDQVTEGVRE
ncbi:MAG TPA: M20/M25/M40 family metallo-hydrolase [Gaiellaceae bacterium]|nr:M20/M25/M40 family metallo-hydrolase [Gaiellaceae bacterium]